MCIKTQNRLVNIVEFGEMAQGLEEPIAVNLARLRGAAANCCFKLKCSKPGCDQQVDYSEDMISYQLVRGLSDAAIQEEVLSKEATNPNMSLDDIVKLVEAKEQGKRGQNLLGGGNINSLRQDYNSKRNNWKNNGPDNKTRSFRKCFNCGFQEHGISRMEKMKYCKAAKHS